MTLGEKIYKLRTKRSMTQEQLAEKIGVSRQSVSKWETDSAIPDIEKLKLLAEIFEVSITELLGMECEEDTKRKDEKESIEHCQKEIKRWKRYAIVSYDKVKYFEKDESNSVYEEMLEIEDWKKPNTTDVDYDYDRHLIEVHNLISKAQLPIELTKDSKYFRGYTVLNKR